MPAVVDAVEAAHPSAILQPFTNRLLHDTRVDFITIMDPTGKRYTHPNPDRIGEQFLGHIDQALAGHVFTETYTGTLGPSVRAVVPIRDGSSIVGLVSVGVTLGAIEGQVSDRML